MYAMYDKKIGYLVPSFQPNDAIAIRNFEQDITGREAREVFHLHPEDFNLQKVGTYDTDTGMITPQTPVVLVDAGEYIRKEIPITRKKGAK